MDDERINIVYFSSTTENTKRFVDKVGFTSYRIPLRASDPFLNVVEPYVLITPTYGGDGSGTGNNAVPKQVIKFLNDKNNRDLCLGVISSGNRNFFEGYALSGKVISEKLGVPWMFSFELLGLPDDVQTVHKGLIDRWDDLLRMRGL